MNENLMERFGRSKKAYRPGNDTMDIWIQPQRLNEKIREYYLDSKKPVDGGKWLDRPETPTNGEVLDTDTESSGSSDIVEIVPNKKKGAWESKEAYLSAHYELLREDAVRPLREAVSLVKRASTGNEENFGSSVGIYEKVHICAVVCSTRGIAIRVTFSLGRVGKKIRWEQSKRLISGSLVVLTPVDDMFQAKAVVATVAARPVAALEQNPPEIDLFIDRASEFEIDPAKEWVMVEERSGYYEAYRHTLLALQKMMREPFPLKEHLVDAQKVVSAPYYRQQQPRVDMTSVFRNNKHEKYENIDITKSWPTQPASDLDDSQQKALRRILTKRLAFVQGPPGCGKTFISVQAIKIMLANCRDGGPPIIIACQTNHAVDQILRHIATFEEKFIRLGGRSKDKDVIKKRTLYEVRQEVSDQPLAGCWKPNSRKKMKELEKEIALILAPLKPEKTPMDFRMLEKVGLLTAKQAGSLESGASRWVQDKQSSVNEARSSPFNVWLGKALISVPLKQQPEEFGFEYEEADLAFEQLRELEAENLAKDDEDFESLTGVVLALADNFTCRKVTGMTEARVKEALKQANMWDIPEGLRGEVYRYLQNEAKTKILNSVREKVALYNELAKKRRIGQWEEDETILKTQHVIGMTTTGFSKYRGLIAGLRPKVILIEEAAETLEAPVTVACIPSLQHLILVGDHEQLRPHCQVKAHEDRPYYLNISLFERLIKNKLEFSMLTKQRRMIPEIRAILHPIYGDKIEDHASVRNPENRPDVPGMGGLNSYFFTHQWSEQRDDLMSAYNPDEADMIVGFFQYLVWNGMEADKITVLTFYNGQRKRILANLRSAPALAGMRFNVVTVDSYQGEENDVVLLSLVRSNDKGAIGFLNIRNRVCVALSRAKRGFYIFGNGMLLHKTNKTWEAVIEIMAKPYNHLGDTLPVRCSNHDEVTEIAEPEEWDAINGGCTKKCNGRLPCGHDCEILCHPFPHDDVSCRQVCGKPLPCGHGTCENACGETCSCKTCSKKRAPAEITNDQQVSTQLVPFEGKETLAHQSSDSESWKSFAVEEPARYAAAAASMPVPRSDSPLKMQLPGDEDANLLSLPLEFGGKKLSFGADGTVSQSSSSRPTSTMSGVATEGDGGRKKWKDVYVNGLNASPVKAEGGSAREDAVKAAVDVVGEKMKAVKQDWSGEPSLLD